MLWIEMSRDKSRPNDEWGLGRSLWSPTEKQNGASWPFWENVLRVEEGDIVLHLVGEETPSFTAFSTADCTGYVTSARPTDPEGEYAHTDTFHRVHLRDFTPFGSRLPIEELFNRYEEGIIEYYETNKQVPRSKKRSILPVVQGDRLQCLNGAYLTEVEGQFREMVLAYLDEGLDDNSTGPSSSKSTDNEKSKANPNMVPTGSKASLVEQRVGQKKFRNRVRSNWDDQCCFPGCKVEDKSFLVGAHIARWADNPNLRGDLKNGLCLCLMHDKAFENGLFTLTAEHRIWTTEERADQARWAEEQILPHVSDPIDDAPTMPGSEPLLRHWIRVGLNPMGEEA
jgi:putative restriction endonuclease